MQTNAPRGLYELGEVLPEGFAALAELGAHLPAILVNSLREQRTRVQRLDTGSPPWSAPPGERDARDPAMPVGIAAIPGVGLMTDSPRSTSDSCVMAYRSDRNEENLIRKMNRLECR